MIRHLKTASLALVTVFALTACETPSGAARGLDVVPVNTSCPVMPDHEADSDVTADYAGQKIAFCCKKCIGKWEDWSADRKSKYVEDAMKLQDADRR